MGQPSSPTIYQQPSQQEIDATKATNQQKAAALTKLNQSIFAESRGLRGMGGLYEWAGPTPDLAANMTAANMWRRPKPASDHDADDQTPWGWNKPGPFTTHPGGWTTGKGIAPLPPGESPGWNAGKGPRGDRSEPGWTGYVWSSGGGPRGDRTTPGWVPATGGGPGREHADQPTVPSPYQEALDARIFKAGGLPAPKFPQTIPPTPTQVAQTDRNRINAAMAAAGVPKANLLPATVKPVPPPPQKPVVPSQAATALGLKPPPAAAPAAKPQAAPAPMAPSAPSTKPAVSAAPAAQTPIAPVKPLTPTAVTRPLSNILYQTTVRPSLYSAGGPNTGGGRR